MTRCTLHSSTSITNNSAIAEQKKIHRRTTSTWQPPHTKLIHLRITIGSTLRTTLHDRSAKTWFDNTHHNTFRHSPAEMPPYTTTPPPEQATEASHHAITSAVTWAEDPKQTAEAKKQISGSESKIGGAGGPESKAHDERGEVDKLSEQVRAPHSKRLKEHRRRSLKPCVGVQKRSCESSATRFLRPLHNK